MEVGVAPPDYTPANPKTDSISARHSELLPPKMTTAINIGDHNGDPRHEHPRPKQEWWLGDTQLAIPTNGERRVYFRTEDGREWRFHRTDPNLALLRQNGKERREEARPPEELRADPKWAGKLLERRTRYTAQKTRRTWRWATLELRPTRIAYYGFTSRMEMRVNSGGVQPHLITKTTYALRKTEETPNPFPIDGADAVHILHHNRNAHKHPSFSEMYRAEQTRQRTERPDLTHYLERGTKWTIVAYTTTTTTYADGRPSKTATKEMDAGRAEYPLTPPLLMLTGFSTKAKADEIPPLTTNNTLDYEYKYKALYTNLEATRRLRAEIKREICEAVLHPDRIDRMATKFDLHPADYVELI